jgi:TPR repeat protein
MVLVFEPQPGTMAIMDKSWHRKTDSRLRRPDVETAPPAADYGNAEVQFNLGLKFANSEGATPDYAQAAEWYGKAADQNHSLAQFNLGMMYARGQGVARDFIQSRRWFGRAAQQGDAGAQFKLGDSCHHASFEQAPEAASESRIEAYKWYRLAAAQGYKDSEMACSILTINMSRTDVAAGNLRVAAFLPGQTPKDERGG